MKNRTVMISGVMSAVLLFSGLVVIAGGSMGWDENSPLKIHHGEDCRDEMMDGLGVPREELDRLEGSSVGGSPYSTCQTTARPWI